MYMMEFYKTSNRNYVHQKRCEFWHSHGRVPQISVGRFKYAYTEVFKIEVLVSIPCPLPFTTPLHIMDAAFDAPSPPKVEHLQRHDPSCLLPMEHRYHNGLAYAVTV